MQFDLGDKFQDSLGIIWEVYNKNRDLGYLLKAKEDSGSGISHLTTFGLIKALQDGSLKQIKPESSQGCSHPKERRGFIGMSAGYWACGVCGEKVD